MVRKNMIYDTPFIKTKPQTINSDKQIIQTVQKMKDALEEKINEVILGEHLTCQPLRLIIMLSVV